MEVQKRIRINFEVSTSEVVSAGINNFTAVTHTGPIHGPDEWLIAKFLDDAGRATGQIPDPATSKDGPTRFIVTCWYARVRKASHPVLKNEDDRCFGVRRSIDLSTLWPHVAITPADFGQGGYDARRLRNP